MNFKIKLRLAALGLALGLLGALIVGVTLTSQRQAEEVSTRLVQEPATPMQVKVDPAYQTQVNRGTTFGIVLPKASA